MGIPGLLDFLRSNDCLVQSTIQEVDKTYPNHDYSLDVFSIFFNEFMGDTKSINRYINYDKDFQFKEGMDSIQSLRTNLIKVGIDAKFVLDGPLSDTHPKMPTVKQRHNVSKRLWKRLKWLVSEKDHLDLNLATKLIRMADLAEDIHKRLDFTMIAPKDIEGEQYTPPDNNGPTIMIARDGDPVGHLNHDVWIMGLDKITGLCEYMDLTAGTKKLFKVADVQDAKHLMRLLVSMCKSDYSNAFENIGPATIFNTIQLIKLQGFSPLDITQELIVKSLIERNVENLHLKVCCFNIIFLFYNFAHSFFSHTA